MRLIKTLRPSKKDTFYDLGSGYAYPCIWIAPKVKLAVGIENFWPRYKRALLNVKKSGLKNIQIIKKSFQKVSLADASIIHCVILLSLTEYRKIENETRPGTTLVLCYPPMFPIKSSKRGGYFLVKFPLARVASANEYARIISGRKNAAIEEIQNSFFPSRLDLRSLKWQISHADYVWEKLKS
jgi:hypothetical protein